MERVLAAWSAMPEAGMHFKKVDSLARGNTAAEIAACVDSGQFASMIVAPAFPEQGRRLMEGRIQTADGVVDLAGALWERGVTFERRARNASMPASRGVVLCDAETDADLRRIVADADRMAARRLFCGSGGLAAALAPPVRAFTAAPLPDLAIIGSQTAVSRANLARLSRHRSIRVAIRSTATAWRDTPDWGAERLAIGFDMPPLAPEAADRAVRTALADLLQHRPKPRTVLVVGGDTLRRVLDTAAATSVDVHGAWAPGIAVSRVADGSWAGSWLYSMSGSFDDVGLVEAIAEDDRCSARS